MPKEPTTASYVELATQGYSLFVNALTSTNQRTLDFMKSVYEISSRPYASSAFETTARENLDRANQIASLAISELQTTGQKSAEFGEQLLAHGAKLQDSYVSSMRGAVETGISNMNYVKETASQQIDEIAKRMDDVQERAMAQTSAN
jgi:hypothetical protein